MSFAHPALLFGLVCVPLAAAAYVIAQRRRQQYAVRFTNLDLLASVVTASPRWRRHVPAALFLLALTALLLATARPQIPRQVPRESASVVLAFDRSGSMRATDVDPTRLAAARRAADRFVDGLPEEFRVGLVAFSSSAEVVALPSEDREQVLQALNSIVAGGGTAMGDGLERAVELAAADVEEMSTDPDSAEQPAAAIVLLSDGANTAGFVTPLEAALEAVRLGIPVFTIALGTDDAFVQIPDRTGRIALVRVPPDRETLRLIAETTGGLAFEAPSDDDLESIYEGLGTRISFDLEHEEVTSAVAAIALLLLAAAGGLSIAWFGRLP